MTIDLVVVTEPNPPGSRQLISPPTAVFEMAPARVLHGAVRLHGLTSSPVPETQVRVACACAACTVTNITTAPANIRNGLGILIDESDHVRFTEEKQASSAET